MNFLYFFAGTFFILIIYHIFLSIGRRFDYTIFGLCIYNIGLIAKIIVKDIFSSQIGNSVLIDSATVVSIAIMVVGLISFTYESFNLAGRKILKFFTILYILSISSLPVTLIINASTGHDYILPVYFLILLLLCILYIGYMAKRFLEDELIFNIDNLIIIINIAVLIPVFGVYSFLTVLDNLSLSISYYTLIFISNIAFIWATSIKLNRDYQSVIRLNRVLNTDETTVISEQAAIKKLSETIHLSNKECEVLECILSGNSNKSICLKLGVNSENTIKSRTNTLFKKCGVRSRQELIKLVYNMRHR